MQVELFRHKHESPINPSCESRKKQLLLKILGLDEKTFAKNERRILKNKRKIKDQKLRLIAENLEKANYGAIVNLLRSHQDQNQRDRLVKFLSEAIFFDSKKLRKKRISLSITLTLLMTGVGCSFAEFIRGLDYDSPRYVYPFEEDERYLKVEQGLKKISDLMQTFNYGEPASGVSLEPSQTDDAKVGGNNSSNDPTDNHQQLPQNSWPVVENRTQATYEDWREAYLRAQLSLTNVLDDPLGIDRTIDVWKTCGSPYQDSLATEQKVYLWPEKLSRGDCEDFAFCLAHIVEKEYGAKAYLIMLLYADSPVSHLIVAWEEGNWFYVGDNGYIFLNLLQLTRNHNINPKEDLFKQLKFILPPGVTDIGVATFEELKLAGGTDMPPYVEVGEESRKLMIQIFWDNRNAR